MLVRGAKVVSFFSVFRSNCFVYFFAADNQECGGILEWDIGNSLGASSITSLSASYAVLQNYDQWQSVFNFCSTPYSQIFCFSFCFGKLAAGINDKTAGAAAIAALFYGTGKPAKDTIQKFMEVLVAEILSYNRIVSLKFVFGETLNIKLPIYDALNL